MNTLGANYGISELRIAYALEDAINNYLINGTMPNEGTLYGISEKRLAIAIAENTTIGGGGSAAWGAITGNLASQSDLSTALSLKQNSLVSGTNIKTINSNSLLGSGNINISTSPAGTTGQIQFNNAGSFGAINNLVWSETTTSSLSLLNFTNSSYILFLGSGVNLAYFGVEGSAGSLLTNSAAGDFVWRYPTSGRILIGNAVSSTPALTIKANGFIGINSINSQSWLEIAIASGTQTALVLKGASSQSGDICAVQNASSSVLSVLAKADGSYKPASLADSSATNNSFYYSTTLSRLTYKDNSGNVFAQNKRQFVTKTANYTLTIADDFVRFNGTTLAATLPDATTMSGHEFEIKNINISPLTINTTSSQLMDANLTVSLIQYEALKVVSNGTSWDII